MPNGSIGARLKTLRLDRGLTQDEVGQRVLVSKQTLYKYENDIVTNIPADKIEMLAEVYGVTPAYIMGWKDAPLIAAEEIAPYGKKVTEKVTEADLNKMLTSGGVLMFGDKKLTEEQKKVLLSVAAAMVKEDSDA